MSISSVTLINYFHDQINKTRQDPSRLISALDSRKFDEEKIYQHPLMPNIRFKTQQGEQAVKEATQYLKLCNSRNSLTLSELLCEVAYQVGKVMARRNFIQDGNQYLQSIYKQVAKLTTKNFGQINVIIEYGFRQDPNVLPSIIVDDGDPNRNRRNHLMNPGAQYVGIGVHEHSEFDYMILLLLTDRIDEGGCGCSIF